MKKIKLTKGKFAIVDDVDFKYLNKYKWSYLDVGYAITYVGGGKKNPKFMLMHKMILDVPNNKVVDHIDGDGLNNTRDNLRACTHAQNHWNKKNKEKVYGIDWHAQSKKWRARIMKNRKEILLGLFKDIEDAIKARKEAESNYYGEYA